MNLDALYTTIIMILIIFCSVALVRLPFVYRYHMKLLDEVYQTCKRDLDATRLRGEFTEERFIEWTTEFHAMVARGKARWAWLDTVPWTPMIVFFWKRPSRFHDPMPYPLP